MTGAPLIVYHGALVKRKGKRTMRNIMKMIEQATKLIDEREDLDMYIGEMKEFYNTFENLKSKHSLPDTLFYLIEDVYHFGLAVGYEAGTEESK